jgi:hypothetical protein
MAFALAFAAKLRYAALRSNGGFAAKAKVI